MASISDVENALTTIIAAILYPTGSPPCILGYPVKIYAGWPSPQDLDRDMTETAAGKPAAAHVSVFPLAPERNTTRYPPDREENAAPATTYTLVAAGQVVTVGGTAPVTYTPQNLAVFVNGKPYVVQATAAETAAQLATALRALIVVDVPGTTVVGAAITLPAGARIGALRVGGTGSTTRPVGEQEKQFQVCAWNSTPDGRGALSDAYQPTLQDVTRVTMPDGSIARVRYHGSRDDDFSQKVRIYRRFVVLTVEYATTITEAAPQMVAGETDTSASDGTPLNTTYS